jgi:hypothetical protein
MRAPIVIVLAAAVVPWDIAQAQIYRCENNGVIEYSNSPASATQRNCQKIELPDITTLPPPKPPPRTAAAPAPGSAPAAAGNFPRVDPAAQRTRDLDRRRILQDELGREENRLAELRREYNGGEPERRGDERNYQKYLDRVQRLKEDIARAEGNVASLRREVAAIRE